MLIVLPPSEGKAPAPETGAPVALGELSFPELTVTRERVAAALVKVSGGAPKRALTALGLSAGQAAELERNVVLLEAPALPAAELYTGVLYDHLGLARLPQGARERARTRLVIFSGLWGALHVEDRVPPYRCSVAARLPRLGGLAARWRASLTRALPADGLVVDLRSGPYQAMWKPVEADVVAVRVLTETPLAGGEVKRSVVSHMAKATRGDVAAALLRARRDARDPEDVATLLGKEGMRVELAAPARRGQGWQLDVVLDGGT